MNTQSSDRYSLISDLTRPKYNHDEQIIHSRSHVTTTLLVKTAMNPVYNCMASCTLLVWLMKPTGAPALVPLLDGTEKARESFLYKVYRSTFLINDPMKFLCSVAVSSGWLSQVRHLTVENKPELLTSTLVIHYTVVTHTKISAEGFTSQLGWQHFKWGSRYM